MREYTSQLDKSKAKRINLYNLVKANFIGVGIEPEQRFNKYTHEPIEKQSAAIFQTDDGKYLSVSGKEWEKVCTIPDLTTQNSTMVMQEVSDYSVKTSLIIRITTTNNERGNYVYIPQKAETVYNLCSDFYYNNGTVFYVEVKEFDGTLMCRITEKQDDDTVLQWVFKEDMTIVDHNNPIENYVYDPETDWDKGESVHYKCNLDYNANPFQEWREIYLARELYKEYKEQWKRDHVSKELEKETMAQYEIAEEEEYFNSFEEYVEEYGYADGSIYASYDEWLENKFGYIEEE